MRAQKNPLIMVVEDNADDEALTMRCLRKAAPDAQLAVARDGEQALKCLDRSFELDGHAFDQPPDLIILDLKLPRVNGSDVLKELRACDITSCVPIVVFSSSDDPDDVVKCYRGGASTYVVKPVDFEGYDRAIGMIVNYWFDLAHLPASCETAVA